jgi:hypothetical protein
MVLRASRPVRSAHDPNHNQEVVMAKMELASLAEELKALESETFEIVDYTEVSEELMGSTSCSCSSCCSTCSSTTSTTSCCA